MSDMEIKECIVKMRYGMEIGYGQEIVRCKDCKNSGMDTTSHPEYWCSAHAEYVEGDGFCWLGEHKEGR